MTYLTKQRSKGRQLIQNNSLSTIAIVYDDDAVFITNKSILVKFPATHRKPGACCRKIIATIAPIGSSTVALQPMTMFIILIRTLPTHGVETMRSPNALR